MSKKQAKGIVFPHFKHPKNVEHNTMKAVDNGYAEESSSCCLVFRNTDTRHTPCNGTATWDASRTGF